MACATERYGVQRRWSLAVNLVCCVLSCALSTRILRAQPESESVSKCPLFHELVADGIQVTESQKFSLQPPSFSVGQSVSEQHAAADRLAGEDGWDRFARESVVAPIRVAIESFVDSTGMRLGYQVHTAYLVHATMEQLRDQSLMERLFGSREEVDEEGSFLFRQIKEDELVALGFKNDRSSQAFARIEVPVLTRLRLHGVIRVERDEQPEQLDIAWIFDNTLSKMDAKYRATWQRLTVDNLGNLVPGPEQLYQGSAGYLRLTQLEKPRSGVFVEMRWLLHEPREWFDGGNLLRSKLPLLIQESVRSFRRKFMAGKGS